MTNNLTVIRNHKKIASLNLNKMEQDLNISKETVELYHFKLAVIAEKHFDEKVRINANKHLTAQDQLQNNLSDLMNQVQSNKFQLNTSVFSEKENKVIQLETAINDFEKIQTALKQAYSRFTNKYFQEGWRQSYMIA